MTLPIIQAKWQLGLLRAEEIPEHATSLLVAGIESPALIELAGLIAPDRWQVGPLLDAAFNELGLPPIDDTAARWRLVYHTAREIVARAVSPLEGSTTLWHLASDLGLPESISYFVYLAADYGEGPGDRATEIAWFDAKIVETARRLLGMERADQPPFQQAVD
jgi:hypothetical protein